MKVTAQQGQTIMPVFIVKAIFSVDGGKRWLPIPPFQMEADTIQAVAIRMGPAINRAETDQRINVRLISIEEGELPTFGEPEKAERDAMRKDAGSALYLKFYAELVG